MTLKVLLVDDEALARARLCTLLAECSQPSVMVVAEAANATQALVCMARERFDAVLLDVRMPGADGVSLARRIADMPEPPAVVFVTAHAEHAVQAFEVAAIDYLTKPVRLERLQQALQKVQRHVELNQVIETPSSQDVLIIQDRGRTERLPVDEVLYFKAELKYITVKTAARSYILDGSINELEEKYAQTFLRVHRNALVARHAMRALVKHYEPEEGQGWAVELKGTDELLVISRRQLAAVRGAIAA